MLGKLIKYDFKAIAKNMVPIFAAMLIMSITFALMIRMDVNQENFFFILFIMLYMATTVACVVGTLVCVVKRFDTGLLRNEGYLSFALPIDTATHIAAKVIDSLIWSFLQGLVLIVSFVLMGLILGSVEDIKEFFMGVLSLFELENVDVLIAGLKGILIMVLHLIAAICVVYAAIAVAHLFEGHRRTLMALFLVVFATINSYLMSFNMNFFWYIQPIISAAVFAALTWYILDRKLNLE